MAAYGCNANGCKCARAWMTLVERRGERRKKRKAYREKERKAKAEAGRRCGRRNDTRGERERLERLRGKVRKASWDNTRLHTVAYGYIRVYGCIRETRSQAWLPCQPCDQHATASSDCGDRAQRRCQLVADTCIQNPEPHFNTRYTL